MAAHLEPALAAKTLAHELAHVSLHDGTAGCRGVAEVEAESVAYLVTNAAGLDSGSYSLPYVAMWAGGHQGRTRGRRLGRPGRPGHPHRRRAGRRR